MLREVLLAASNHKFETQVTATRPITRGTWRGVDVTLYLSGGRDFPQLLAELSELDGVESVQFAHDSD